MESVIKYILTGIVPVIFLSVGFARANTDVIFIEDAIEAEKISVSINSNMTGHIIADVCPTCKSTRLAIDKNTQLFHKGKRIHLINLKKANGQPATVFYDIRKKIVTRIKW
ncbi:MAG TPA: hypothetical protein ENJ08_11285 [Gammaproteobacteria bacterium]|nr:hypothetical protein [Gammaproteobacteria bacterium]